MLHHVGISVADFEASKLFYSAALAPLGVRLLVEKPILGRSGMQAAFGSGGKPCFWLYGSGVATDPIHVAFVAESCAAVDAFYVTATAARGRNNGGPGYRPQYHRLYYAAFVLDPDDNNIEAVYRASETSS
jgi:catechol 2,3-dioxygenase-like lactoylglutathione lyase family enzyme